MDDVTIVDCDNNDVGVKKQKTSNDLSDDCDLNESSDSSTQEEKSSSDSSDSSDLNDQEEELNLDRLGTLNRFTVATTGLAISKGLDFIAKNCQNFLKKQLEILKRKLQSLAFGQHVDGVHQNNIGEALAYLTMRTEEIDQDLQLFNNMLTEPSFSSQHINTINRIYPSIYRECLEENGVVQPIVREPRHQDQPQDQPQDIRNRLGLLANYFNQIDNMDHPGILLRPNAGRLVLDNPDEPDRHGQPPVLNQIDNVMNVITAMRGGDHGINPFHPQDDEYQDVKVPLKISVVRQMKNLHFHAMQSQNDTCPVCLIDMEAQDEVVNTVLCCNKSIHQECAYEWWDVQHTCPSCGINLHNVSNVSK